MTCFFLLVLWIYWLTASDLQSFWWEIFLLSYWVFLVCDNLLMICCFEDSLYLLKVWLWCVLMWVSLSSSYWGSLSFLAVYIHVFPEIWISAIISSNILSAIFYPSSPFGTLMTGVLVCLLMSHRSLRLCLLFFSFLSFCSSNLVISIVLSSSSLTFFLSACSIKSAFQSL